MAVTRDQVLAALEGVASPTGPRCPGPARCRTWWRATARCSSRSASMPRRSRPGSRCASAPRRPCARCRACSRRWSRSPPSARPGGRRAAAAAPQRRPSGRARRAARRIGAGRSGRRGDHRGRVRQGRRRQIDHRGQSGARACRARAQGRHPRRRHLRAVAAEAARHQGAAADARRHAAQADHALWAHRDVDRLPDRRGDADDLARADGDLGAHPDAARGRVGRRST